MLEVYQSSKLSEVYQKVGMEYLHGKTRNSIIFRRHLHRGTASSYTLGDFYAQNRRSGNAKEKSSLHLDRREFDQETRFSLPKKQPGRRTKLPVDQEDDSGTAEGT